MAEITAAQIAQALGCQPETLAAVFGSGLRLVQQQQIEAALQTAYARQTEVLDGKRRELAPLQAELAAKEAETRLVIVRLQDLATQVQTAPIADLPDLAAIVAEIQ